ncbi:MAG: PD-(D/E)XK nuclease family protein [Candidatus Altiarchaeota archaeon]|nr:PD-(D/E)XK nuclease family protein [Candidatus Altiarchaeota archaeon]
MIFSHSRIECFNECPRKFRYRYIDKVVIEDFDTVERYMGRKVHEALEYLYKKAMYGDAPDIDDIVRHYNSIWSEGIGDNVMVVNDGATHDDYRILGERCIADYFEKHAPFDSVKTIATELLVRTDLKNDGNYRLVGYIDRVDRVGDGVYEIHDYKTSSKVLSQNKADDDRQLTIYEMGLRTLYNDVHDVEYVWHYLAHGKEIRSKRDVKDIEAHKREIIDSIHRIEEAIVEGWYPAVKTPKCMWCEYQSICSKSNDEETKQTRVGDYIY